MFKINNLLTPYLSLMEFLSYTYGPDYEIVLHNFTGEDTSVIAIINGHISGRQVGSPLNRRTLEAIKANLHQKQDYIYDYTSVFSNGKTLRSNTYFIKDVSGAMIGLLSINFDDSRYRNVMNEIMELCHPSNFIKQKYIYQDTFSKLESPEEIEQFHSNTEETIDDTLNKISSRLTVPLNRLTLNEKLNIVGELDSSGIFYIKGAVKYVSEKLNCSQASLYRYLKQTKESK